MMKLSIVLVYALNILVVQSQAQGLSGTNSLGFNAPTNGNCICTPFYRCYDLETSNDLNGIVDDRTAIINGRPVVSARQTNEPEVCPDILDVCCHNLVPSSPQPQRPPPVRPLNFPSSPHQPIRPSQIPGAVPAASSGGVPLPVNVGIRQPTESTQECGVRNMGGVGFSVQGFTEGQAQYGEFPWMVALLTENTGFGADQGANNLYLGGGSLIDPLVVLTAAHKPYDNANKKLIVRVGEWNFRADNEPTQHQDIPVRRVIMHPRFHRGARTYNYALLILERPAVMGETVRTICLPSNPRQVFDGQRCIISGWGKDNFGEAGKYQKILKSVNVNMVAHSRCQDALRTTRLGTTFDLHSSFVCAGDEGLDACTGDGGSPLVCPDPMSPGQYVQVGISAWGLGCGQKGIPGVYSAVAQAIDWIQEELDTLFAVDEIPFEEEILVDDRLVIGGAINRKQCPKSGGCNNCHRFSRRTARCHRIFRCRC